MSKSKSIRKVQNRRDRRKAKQSNFAREGTKNPRKRLGHHVYSNQLAAGKTLKFVVNPTVPPPKLVREDPVHMSFEGLPLPKNLKIRIFHTRKHMPPRGAIKAEDFDSLVEDFKNK